MANAVQAIGASKTYGEGRIAVQALKPTDLTIPLGQICFLVGPSGSGKTTLLSLIGCVLRPTAGRVVLFGDAVSERRERDLPDLRLALVGFVFQGHNLIASLSALDNVALPLRLTGTPSLEARQRAAHLLDAVGLGKELARKPAALSGGQKQRVAIARALVGTPPLLLADEPTASLDAAAGRHVVELMVELSRKMRVTPIIVTHDNRIFDLAERIVQLEDGRIVADSLTAAAGGAVGSAT